MEPAISEFLELIKRAIKKREYLKWVAYAHRLLSLFDQEISLEAKDLVSEIIDKVCTGKRKWNRKVDLDRFMYMNIASYFYNFRKKQKRLVYEPDNEDEDDDLEDGTKLGTQIFRSPDSIIDRYDFDDIYEKCKNRLDENEKRVLIELNEGASPDEVGTKMGLDRTQVYYLRNRIKNKIRRMLIS